MATALATGDAAIIATTTEAQQVGTNFSHHLPAGEVVTVLWHDSAFRRYAVEICEVGCWVDDDRLNSVRDYRR